MNSEKAKKLYKESWFKYRATYSFKKKKALKQKMDAIQPYIEGWEEFKNELPGFVSYQNLRYYMNKNIKRRDTKCL